MRGDTELRSRRRNSKIFLMHTSARTTRVTRSPREKQLENGSTNSKTALSGVHSHTTTQKLSNVSLNKVRASLLASFACVSCCVSLFLAAPVSATDADCRLRAPRHQDAPGACVCRLLVRTHINALLAVLRRAAAVSLPGRWPRLQQQPAQFSFSLRPFRVSSSGGPLFTTTLSAVPFPPSLPRRPPPGARARCSCCECELRSFVCCFVFILAAMMTELFARALLSRSQTQVLGNLPGAERARVASNQRRVARPSEPILFAPLVYFRCRAPPALPPERRSPRGAPRARSGAEHACVRRPFSLGERPPRRRLTVLGLYNYPRKENEQRMNLMAASCWPPPPARARPRPARAGASRCSSP